MTLHKLPPAPPALIVSDRMRRKLFSDLIVNLEIVARADASARYVLKRHHEAIVLMLLRRIGPEHLALKPEPTDG